MSGEGCVRALEDAVAALCFLQRLAGARFLIRHRYHTGELPSPTLVQLIKEGVLRVPPAKLANDVVRWGLGELSLAARKERREALWPSAKVHRVATS